MISDAHQLKIDPDRLRYHFEALAAIGATPEGGVHRPAMGTTDAAARKWFRKRIEAAGLKYACDPAGNQSALLGEDKGQEPRILLGSHLDTVPAGGRYDGALGVLAALEVLQTLKEAGVRPSIALEAINFTDEEGTHIGTLGSRALTGLLIPNDLENPFQGRADFVAGLNRLGLQPKNLPLAKRPNREVAAYVELHIEQGPILAREQDDIGIVTAIVAIGRQSLRFHGQADHAGTTPMHLRRDAGKAAAVFVARAWNAIPVDFGDSVINIGDMRFHPGAFNVVPQAVAVDLEYRSPGNRRLTVLQTALLALAQSVARENQVALEAGPAEISPAAGMDTPLQGIIARAAKRLGLRHRTMSSGAGHDAQSFSNFCPTAMIFIPSEGGRSHTPQEFSRWRDCINGTNLLLQATIDIMTAHQNREPVQRRFKSCSYPNER